jgi:hypothetical protein
LDSGSYREHHFNSIIGVLSPLNNNQQQTCTTSQLHLLSNINNNLRQLNINNNLIMRYKHCTLGHSDPQLYTHTQQPFFALTSSFNNVGNGATLNNTSSNSGMFGGLSSNFTTNGSRRSFLSSSPQAFKLKVLNFIRFE